MGNAFNEQAKQAKPKSPLSERPSVFVCVACVNMCVYMHAPLILVEKAVQACLQLAATAAGLLFCLQEK